VKTNDVAQRNGEAQNLLVNGIDVPLIARKDLYIAEYSRVRTKKEIKSCTGSILDEWYAMGCNICYN